jgi:hypothetical protein
MLVCDKVLVLGGAFEVLCVGGKLVHIWSISWCFEVWSLEHLRCTSAHLEVVSIDLNVYNA